MLSSPTQQPMQRCVPGDDSGDTEQAEDRGVHSMGVVGKEGAILDVQRDGSTLTIRLDGDSWPQSGFVVELPVITLVLSACEDVEHIFGVLQQAKGDELYYEVHEEAAGSTVGLCIDYERVAEATSDYEIDDWKSKCRRLAALYVRSADERVAIADSYYRLTTRLETEIGKELERCERKIAFFRDVRPERAARAQAQADAYRKVLTLMVQIREDNQSRQDA
jgi:hypothetical protein